MELTRSAGLIYQAARFGASTGLSAAMTFLLPITLHEIGGVRQQIAVAIGFTVAYLLNFIVLRAFVFRSGNSLRADALRYLPVNGAFRLAEYCAFLILDTIFSVGYVLAIFIVLVTSTILKFFGYRRLFRPGGR